VHRLNARPIGTQPWQSKGMALKQSVRLATILVCFLSAAGLAPAQPTHKTENVIVVMMDGMRWQEVFRGADADLIKTPPANLPDGDQRVALAKKAYGRETQAQRRAALMPFLWSVVATEGQVFGNRDLGSDSHVTNGLNFSYPGYSETITGVADPRVHSNDNVPNPNVNVFEWLNQKPAFAGKVAVFGAWDTFTGIFNQQRSGLLINDGYAPFTGLPGNPRIELLNALKAATPRYWLDEPFDAVAFYTAIEYVKTAKPRLLFIGLGETDDWAHAGEYAEYLNAAHLGDSFLSQLWDLVQSMPEYRGKTTLIVLPDHGRGEGAKWTDHGEKIPESMQTWMAFLGPDTPSLGERKNSSPVTESQIAATIAALLGEDYRAAYPKAGAAIADVLQK